MKPDIRPRRRNSPRIAEKSAEGFKQWVRGRPCAFKGLGPCEGKIEAMHLDFAGGKGMQTKVADRFVIPGCWRHHKRQTDRGWNTFLKEMNETKEALLNIAEYLWKHWPGRAAWLKKVGLDA